MKAQIFIGYYNILQKLNVLSTDVCIFSELFWRVKEEKIKSSIGATKK